MYDGIQKLVIVDIALDFGSNNPPLIFEISLHGLSLSQADLNRNYGLMEQESFKTDCMRLLVSMEQSFGEEYVSDRSI